MRDRSSLVAGDDLVDVLLRAQRHQGFFRHDDGALAHVEDHARARKHAGPELALGVVDARPHEQRAAVGVDLRVERFNAALEGLTGNGVDDDGNRQTHADAPEIALGQAEVDNHRRKVLHVDDVGTVFEVVAHTDQSDASHAIERRQHFHARELRLRQRHLCVGHLQRRDVLVDRTLADEALCQQLAAALQIGARDARLRLRLLQLRLLQVVVELHQQLPAPHAATIGKTQHGDAPADLGLEHHALARSHGAHGLHIVGQRDGHDLGDFDGHRRARPPCWPQPGAGGAHRRRGRG